MEMNVQFAMTVRVDVQFDRPVPDAAVKSLTGLLRRRAHLVLEAGMPVLDRPAIRPPEGDVATISFQIVQPGPAIIPPAPPNLAVAPSSKEG